MIKEKLKEKLKNKKTEKLVSILVILIVTLIIINSILKDENKIQKDNSNNTIQLVQTEEKESQDNLEEKLKTILSQIEGVGKVDVLITYSESSSINPLYNENSSSSTTEENADSANKKITKTESNSKEILTDSSSNPVIQKTSSPKIEGSVIIAEGARVAQVKSNIISAVEAATGLATHKIQVFEMKK